MVREEEIPVYRSILTEAGSKKYMKLNAKVVEGRWDEEQGIWNL